MPIMVKLNCLGRDKRLPRRVIARCIGRLHQGTYVCYCKVPRKAISKCIEGLQQGGQEGYRNMYMKVTAR